MACGASRWLTVARTSAGPHPLTGKIFHLSDQGYSQRRIAAETKLSQSTVNRVLSGSRPSGPSDPEGVFAEFDELYAAAKAENTIEAYRRVHQVALTCHDNGYAVPFHPLPYLMLLSAALIEARSAGERNKLNAEIMAVYADLRAWRERQ